MAKIKIGIIGGTGYTGVELLRLLVTHPNVELAVISSRGEAGNKVADLFPNLRGFTDIVFSAPTPDSFKGCDIVFSATPNGIAMTYAQTLLDNGIKLIDLAADFRIKDITVWEQWYGMKHACPELVEQAVYGLPELDKAQNRKLIKQANIVANPGCYPTATSLGLLPLVKSGLINTSSIIADTKSGATGAGRGASVANLYSEVSDSFKAYGVGGHRHHPEITQVLSSVTDKEIGLTFVPHLTPMLRGIYATLYSDLLNSATSLDEIQSLYEETYAGEAFVDVMPLGSLPESRSVKATNICRIAVHQAVGSNKIVVLSTIDNLTKGAAGQAVQNMNIMCDFPETTGLLTVALLP